MRPVARAVKDIFEDVWIRCVLFAVGILPGRPGNALVAPLRRRLLRLLRVDIGVESQLSPGLMIFRTGNFTAGTGCRFGYSFHVWNFAPLDIGDRLLASHGIKVICGTHKVSMAREDVPGPVVIGDDVWLGASVTIVGPARIGNGVIVGANSFVSGNLEPGWIYAGAPAKKIRRVADTSAA